MGSLTVPNHKGKPVRRRLTMTGRERAFKFGVPETSLRRTLEGLAKRKFVEQGADKKYRLTTKGRKEILTLVQPSPEHG
jgi:Mn-dependent DtxR family transcriptional regulator